MGFLITAILVVNNLRDIATDRAAGKKTLAVRLGASGTRWEYTLCLVAAYLVPLIFMACSAGLPLWSGLSWLSLPWALRRLRDVWREEGRPLNQALAGTGRLTLIYLRIACFSAGIDPGRHL